MCGPHICSISIIWELLRNANSQAHRRLTDSETLRAGPSNLCFDKSSRWSRWELCLDSSSGIWVYRTEVWAQELKSLFWLLSLINCNLEWVTTSSRCNCPNHIIDKAGFLLHKEVLRANIWKHQVNTECPSRVVITIITAIFSVIKLLQPVILTMNSKPVFQGSHQPTQVGGINCLTSVLHPSLQSWTRTFKQY